MVEIRIATPEDAAAILAFCKLAGAETDNLSFGAEGVPFSVEQEQEFLEYAQNSRERLFLLAICSGKIVGTGTFSAFQLPRLAHRGEISITVRQEFWGQHIGSQLMEEILRFARDVAQARILSLEVRTDNSRAIALYKKFGFETVGTFPGYMNINGENISCDIMRLAL